MPFLYNISKIHTFSFNTIHAESPFEAIFKTPLISYEMQKKKQIFIHRYQTPADTDIRNSCYTLRNAGLLQLVIVDRSHLTCARRSQVKPLVPLRSKEAVLSLFDDTPEEYETASKMLFPNVRTIPAVPAPEDQGGEVMEEA